MSSQAAEEYDEVQEGYEESRTAARHEYVTYPSFSNSLEDVQGKRVIDLACGYGKTTRMIKEEGAAEVLGVDVSDEQIERAREIERQRDQGIKYVKGNVAEMDLSKYGEFDMAATVTLLHYAESREELDSMLENIRNCLKPGGEFVGLIIKPGMKSYKGYGFKITPKENEEEVTDGSPLLAEVHDRNWNKHCEFTNYYWKKSTYEEAFEENGFDEHEWIDVHVTEEGKEEFGEEFWQDMEENPPYEIFKLQKA